eukprot:3349769-Pyramimonas_sp.AAC.1
MFPNWVNQRRQQHKFGVGYEQEKISAAPAHFVLWRLLRGVRESGKLPLSWILSDACKIGKGNEKEGVDGERLIMLVCTLAKAYY